MTSTTATATARRERGSTFAMLQRIGRSLMMPIAVLPAAALLLRLGQDDLLGRTDVGWLDTVAKVLGESGNALFANLPLLFAVGVAIGFARKSDGSTALAALVGYLIFDRVTRVVFASIPKGWSPEFQAVKARVVDADGAVVFNTANPTGVLGGILVGVMAALLWQRYYRVKLPPYLAFFGGRRFVPIVTAAAAIVLGVVMGFVWLPVGALIDTIGNNLADSGAIGAGIYGAVNRALLPFGLHHIINALVWFQIPTCPDFKAAGDLNCYFAGAPNTGNFMAGFFPVMMFGLPAACLAMVHTARPDKRKSVAGILLAAGLVSFVTGVTEPIEFAFLFVAPVLFGIHAVLTGISLALATVLDFRIGFGFSAGAIDYGLNYSKDNSSNPWMLFILGPIYAVVYYFVFRFAILKFNLRTPGREPDDAADAADYADPYADPSAHDDERSTVGTTDTGPAGTAPTRP
jgi:PTS system N-acetylglucosamine-specific IIC component